MKYMLIAFLVGLTPSVFACSCGYGEYFYSIDKLEGPATEPAQYFQSHYGVSDLKNIHKGTLNPQIEDMTGLMVITLPIPDKFRGHVFHFVLESKVTLEVEPNKTFVVKSNFKTAIFKPGNEILELQTRMNSNGNEWFLYLLALNDKGKIVASAIHSGEDTCGKDVYVSSIARAKELDSNRTSGCFQTWGYK